MLNEDKGPRKAKFEPTFGFKGEKLPIFVKKGQQPRLNEILLCEWSYFLCYFSGVCSFFWFDKLNSDDPDTLQYDVVPVIVSSRMFLSSTAIPRPLRNVTLSTMPFILICGSVRAEVLLTATHFIAQKTFILLQLSLEWVINWWRVKLGHNITFVLSNVSWQNAS